MVSDPRSRWLLACVLIALAVTARLLPQPENVTALGAVGLFAGALLPLRSAWLVPVASLLLSDAILGFYSLPVMLMVYLGFAVGACIGHALLSAKRSVPRLAGAVLASASVFFVLSNFAVWLVYYPPTLAGLVQCYVNAIPFFGRSLLGDALYSCLLFGGYAVLMRFQQQGNNRLWH